MSIELKIMQYKDALNTIAKRREGWNDSVKEFIYKTLLETINKFDLNWGVYKNEDLQNLQSVYLEFHQSPSGITKYEGGGGKHFVKKGGALLFSQSYTGKVHVYFSYPVVEEWRGETRYKQKEELNPLDITKDIILNYIQLFIDEMIAWEESESMPKLGFLNRP